MFTVVSEIIVLHPPDSPFYDENRPQPNAKLTYFLAYCRRGFLTSNSIVVII